MRVLKARGLALFGLVAVVGGLALVATVASYDPGCDHLRSNLLQFQVCLANAAHADGDRLSVMLLGIGLATAGAGALVAWARRRQSTLGKAR